MKTMFQRTLSAAVIGLAVAGCLLAGMAVYAQEAAAPGAPDEAQLIATITKTDASWLDKQNACRALRQIGTVQCIPALAALLPDEKLSHAARYALETMPFPEASQALRDGLAAANGLQKAGVIGSIGVRRDADAVPALIPLLSDADATLAGAAAGALGRIATPEALTALDAAFNANPSGPVMEGLLAAGQYLVETDRGALAVPVFGKLLDASLPLHVRMGAFRGKALADPNNANAFLLEALMGTDSIFRDLAAEVVAETSGEASTRFFAEALPKLPEGGQAALLRSLMDRGDAAAAPAVAQAVQSADPAVKIAAIKALGILAGPGEIPALVTALGSEDATVSAEAKASLTIAPGKPVSAAITEALPSAAPAVRAQLLLLLATRRAEQAVALGRAALEDPDTGVRLAALRVMFLLGGADELPAVLAAVKKSGDTKELAAAEKAINEITPRMGASALPLVVAAIHEASTPANAALLRCLAVIGGPEALKEVSDATQSADTIFSGEAVRLLVSWPGSEAVPFLLDMAKGADASKQILGLRGYVRLASVEANLDTRVNMLTTAMGLAKRVDEQRLVLGAWGSTPVPQALTVLTPYLDQADLRDEAGSALVTAAAELGKKAETKAAAVDALKAVIAKCETQAIKDNAQKTIETLP